MTKLLLTGFWVCAITVMAGYGVAYWKAGRAAATPQQEYLEGLEYEKTRVINVPRIADGSVQGYVVAQFVFTIDARTHRQLSVPPNAFVVDEAFRRIYADERTDFANIKKQDLAQLTQAIKQNVNARMQANVIQDVLVEEFTYFSKDDIRR